MSEYLNSEHPGEIILQASNISKSYGQLQVLKEISLKIAAHEFISITGPSGAGKSTLLHILGGLDKPDRGEVLVKGLNPLKISTKKQMKFRNKNIGFVFQFHHLLPEFTALENVCMPLWIAGEKRATAEQRAREILQIVGLENREHHKPRALSGGEQQRVAIARAVINHPDLVFADEPTGNLDSQNAQSVHELFLKLRDSFKLTFIVVTHNETLARLADRELKMKDGRLE